MNMPPREVATRDLAARSLNSFRNEPDHRRKRCRGCFLRNEVLIVRVPCHRVSGGIAMLVMCLSLSTRTSSLTPIISTTLHRHNEQRSTISWNPDSRLLKRVSSPSITTQPKQTTRNGTVVHANSEESLHVLSKRFAELDFLLEEPNGDKLSSLPSDDEDPSRLSTTPICRVVTRSDRKIPTTKGALPDSLSRPPYILQGLDNLFHAAAYSETRGLQYFETSSLANPRTHCARDEAQLVDLTRKSLEDAGFQPLSRRDLDLCEALNAGYLLRLSILPDVSNLDPTIAREFYPELFDSKGDPLDDENEILFSGRVLVFWRGYSSETTKGRLVLPKLDYLQASLVQSAASWLVNRLQVVERCVEVQMVRFCRSVSKASLRMSKEILATIPNKRIAAALRKRLATDTRRDNKKLKVIASTPSSRLFKLARYGGSKIRFVGSPNPNDALDPFMICEQIDRPSSATESGATSESGSCNSDGADARNIEVDMYRCIKSSGLQCPYDQKTSAARKNPVSPMQLLRRVTISSLVDLFSNGGRRALLKSLLAESELVEPTYDEVVVVWRPLPAKEGEEDRAALIRPPKIRPPKFVYDLADMFDIDGLPERPPAAEDRDKKRKFKKMIEKQPLEMRSFSSVPMANVLAVLPKTKLVFRPADAFVFDSISIISFLLVIGSQRFDSPKLDLLAVVSVTLWVIRTVFRYSNKLARYDLLVKTFLTSKITHRNRSALQNLVSEAGTQRAVRAALAHSWLCQLQEGGDLSSMTRSDLVRRGESQVNRLLHDGDGYRDVPVDMDAALNDLTDLGLVAVSQDGDKVQVVSDAWSLRRVLKNCWAKVFDETLNISAIASRHRSRLRREDAPRDLLP